MQRITTITLSVLFIVGCAVALTSWPSFGMRITNLGQISDDLGFLLAGATLLHQNAQWGPDVVFTYGPLEFLASAPLYRKQVPVFLIYRLFFALTTAGLLLALTWQFIQHWGARSLVIVLFGINAYLWFIGWSEALWLTPAMAVGALHITLKKKPLSVELLIWTATTLLGAAALVKFSQTAIYVGIFGLLAAHDLMNRRLPTLSIWFCVSLVVTWILAGQDISNLPTWLVASADLSAGYSDAMSKGFWIPYKPSVVGLSYITAVLLVAIPLTSRIPVGEKILLCLMSLGIAAVNIQHSFGGNQIEHSMVAMGIAASVFGVTLIGTPRILAAICVTGCCVVLSLTGFSFPNFLKGPVWILSHIDHAKRVINGTYDFEAAGLPRLNADIRKLSQLPADISGTADVYTRKTGVVIAYPNLTYHPRPAFLSLNAHTERLAELNAAFLKTSNAPEWIVFEMKASERVNNRYPSTDDGPSWLEIWGRYDLTLQQDDLLLYHKKARAENVAFHATTTTNVTFGEQIIIDPSSPVWIQLDVQRTMLGRVIGAVYKAPQVMIDLTYTDGSKASYQVVPALGRAGFLLSPTIVSSAEFAKRDGKRARAAAFRVEDDIGWFFKPSFQMHLSAPEWGSGEAAKP